MKHFALLAVLCLPFLGASAQSGCTFPDAYNYDPAAVTDDGSCTQLVCADYAGPQVVSFTKDDYADPNDPANQDRITNSLWITRGDQNLLYNAATEASYNQYSSPQGTYWKWGDATSSNEWRTLYGAIQIDGGGGPGSQSLPFTVTLYTPSGLLFEVEFTAWTCCSSGGGFAYTRTLVNDPATCTEVPLAAGCTNPLASNYDPSAYYDDGTCNVQVDGCMDATACNYDPAATMDDGSCYYNDGNFALQCADDINAVLTSAGDQYLFLTDAPVVEGTCDQPSADLEINATLAAINANYSSWLTNLGNTYVFNYDGYLGFEISDGGNDMYDGGNEMNTDAASLIQYTAGAVVTGTQFGTGSSYATLELPGMFAMVANDMDVNYFEITGNNGADGSGTVNGFVGTADGFDIFFKQVCNAGDPSINHLMILPQGSGATHIFATDTNDDQHRVDLPGVSEMIYLLWAGDSGYCYAEADVYDLAQQVSLSLPSGSGDGLEVTSGPTPGDLLGVGSYTTEWTYTSADGMTVVTCQQNINVTLEIEGCMDATACNYNASANIDDGSCYYGDGNLALQCPDDVNVELLYSGDVYQYLPSNIPLVEGICDQPSADLEVNNALTTINNDYSTWLAALGNSFVFGYDGYTGYSISDGGNDMYDGGNQMNTDAASFINYTAGAVATSGEFGVGSSYATLELPGLFAMVANDMDVNYFEITGNNGADGSGTVDGFQSSISGFDVFFKQVCSAGDPSINHLILLPQGSGATQTFATNSDDDQHRVDLPGVNEMIYLLWAGDSGYCYSQSEVFALIQQLSLSFPSVNGDVLEVTSGPQPGDQLGVGMYTAEWSYTSADGMTTVTCQQNITVTSQVSGCTNPAADNYNPSAGIDDGSCFVVGNCAQYTGDYLTSFNKPSGADWTLPENQDFITPTCILTRGSQYGLFNIALETENSGGTYATEPSNTEWKYGPYDLPGTYSTLNEAAEGVIYSGWPGLGQTLPGQTFTMHVVDSDLYFEVTFDSWAAGSQGGFSYTRKFLAIPSGCTEDPLGATGCTDMTACNYDAAAASDDGSCTYPGDACDDGNGATIGDVLQGDCSCAGTLAETSSMDYPAGDYDLCDLIKADWVGADDYRFVFAPQSGGASILVEQGGANTFLFLGNVMGLTVGETYDVTVDVLYGADWAIGSDATAVTIVSPTPYVNPADECINHGPHFKGDYISAKPYVCGGDKWEWTFTAAGELPIVYTRNSSNRYLRLSSVPGLMAGTSYDVTVRAGYPNGAFTPSSASACISILGISPSVVEPPVVEEAIELDEKTDVRSAAMALYPNPNNGELLHVNLAGIDAQQVTLDIMATNGQRVRSFALNVDNNTINTLVDLQGLASGVYLVQVQTGAGVITERLVVQH